MALSARTGGSRHTGLAAPPHENNHIEYTLPEYYRFKSKDCNNLYLFEKTDEKLTIFYEPVISCNEDIANCGIGLYRNNTHVLNTDSSVNGEGTYYTPDYVLKMEKNGRSNYLICDAKFCNRNKLETLHMQELSFRYLFSISPISEQDNIIGLCLFYGKGTQNSKAVSYYNKGKRIIYPIADMIPVFEDIQDEVQRDMLKKLFNYL